MLNNNLNIGYNINIVIDKYYLIKCEEYYEKIKKIIKNKLGKDIANIIINYMQNN